jgi:hypothetical protein
MKNTLPLIVDLNTPQFQTWLIGANKVVEDHRQLQFPGLAKEILVPNEGGRYIKILRIRENQEGRSAFAFIDRVNGDVLKAASWAAPAKHSRGNLFSPDNGLGCVGPYGIAYLR